MAEFFFLIDVFHSYLTFICLVSQSVSQKVKQTDWQTERQTGRQADKYADTQKNR